MKIRHWVRVVILLAVVLGFSVSTTHAASEACSTDNAVLFANTMYGSTCLDNAGWHSYSETSDPVRGNFNQFVSCTDGSLLASTFDTLYTADKTSFKRVTSMKGSAYGLACASPNDVWVNYSSGVSHYDGKHWTTFDVQQDFGAASVDATIGGIGIAPDKTVWVTTEHTLAAYNGKDWKVLDEKSGLDQNFHLNSAPIFDSKGTLYVLTYSHTIVTYDGSSFDSIGNDDLKTIQAFALDSKGNLYVGTDENGLYVYDGSDWKNYTTDDGLGANNIQDIETDDQGRAWIATEWGLSVLVDGKFTTYTMGNSGLIDNHGKVLLVVGKGPELPKPITKKTGTVKGAIQVDGKPLADTQVQLCSLSTFLYKGETPCGTMPDAQTVTTDSKGAFEFDNVTIGRYDLAFQTGTKQWAKALGEKVEVAEGRVTNLNTMKFTSK